MLGVTASEASEPGKNLRICQGICRQSMSDFAHLWSLREFAIIEHFRAFAPKSGKFRILPDHALSLMNVFVYTHT